MVETAVDDWIERAAKTNPLNFNNWNVHIHNKKPVLTLISIAAQQTIENICMETSFHTETILLSPHFLNKQSIMSQHFSY